MGDTEYYENQMIDQFDDPMKFYTKSQTILNNVAPDGQDDHLLVKQKSDGSNDSACLPDPSSYDAESEAACRQDSETAYNNPMDYDCDSDSGDFASVKMERADSNFPEAEPCPEAEADPSPEEDFPEADPSPEEDAPEAEPSQEEDVHEDEPSPEAPVLETIPSVESAATADYSNADPSPESECGSAKPTKKSKTLDSKKKRRKHRGAGKTSAPKKQWGKLKKQLSTRKTKGSKAPQKGKRKGKTTVPRRKKK